MIMIETGTQAQAAIAEIKTKTNWSTRRVALKADINAGTMVRIISGETPAPRESTLIKLQVLLDRVRGL